MVLEDRDDMCQNCHNCLMTTIPLLALLHGHLDETSSRCLTEC